MLSGFKELPPTDSLFYNTVSGFTPIFETRLMREWTFMRIMHAILLAATAMTNLLPAHGAVDDYVPQPLRADARVVPQKMNIGARGNYLPQVLLGAMKFIAL
jgi:hypothetical protein